MISCTSPLSLTLPCSAVSCHKLWWSLPNYTGSDPPVTAAQGVLGCLYALAVELLWVIMVVKYVRESMDVVRKQAAECMKGQRRANMVKANMAHASQYASKQEAGIARIQSLKNRISKLIFADCCMKCNNFNLTVRHIL